MAVGWPQWPGNFSLIIGMYFKILSEPKFMESECFVFISAYQWWCYQLGTPGVLTRAGAVCGEPPTDSSL